MKNKSRATKAKELGLAGILAAGIGLSGCETVNWADVYSVTSGAAADRQAGLGNIDKARGFDALSGLAGLAGQRDYDIQRQEAEAKAMKEAAEAGATRVEQNVIVGAGVNKNTNAYPFEVGKTYEIVFTSKTSNPRRVWNAVVKFNGFGVVNCGEGWEPAYKFDGIDGGTYTRALDELISAKPIE